MLSIPSRISIWVLLALSLGIANAHAITVGTYTAPPYSMHEDGEDIGLATEAIREILQKSGINDYAIINYPIARGLAELQAGRIDIYYPYMIHTKSQEQGFELLGPISRYNVALFVRKDYAKVVSMAAMKDLVVVAERGSIDAFILQQHDMHIEQASQSVSCLRMVLAERVSACAIGTLPGMYAAAINNLTPELRFVETGSYAEMYVALGPSLSAQQIAQIKAAFNQLREENYFSKQQREYEKKFALFIKTLS
jgi:ABC-type amino acid transport substrate-binding protein